MKNKKTSDSNFRAGHTSDMSGVSKPRMGGRNNAPPANAKNSASPSNPGNLNVLSKIKSNGSFKTSN